MLYKSRLHPPPRVEQRPALSDQRFQVLLQQASEKFREAEISQKPTRGRDEVIAEIVDTMKAYNINFNDLLD